MSRRAARPSVATIYVVMWYSLVPTALSRNDRQSVKTNYVKVMLLALALHVILTTRRA